MDHAARIRKMLQTLRTDHLLGLDAVPLADIAPRFTAPVSEDAPEPALRTASPTPEAQKSTAPSPPPGDAAPPIQSNSMSRDEKAAALSELEREVAEFIEASWPRDGWRNVVFGEGDPEADLMFIGEGPGAEEDAQGRPFVGRSGRLLDKQIAAMGLERGQVYIANIAKARPPGNRVPTPDEAGMMMPYLERQIEIIAPQVIVTLGATAAKILLRDPKLAITRQRGRWKSFRGIDLMPTFHPAYLLRQFTVENRRRVWDDLKKVMERLGLPIPEQKSGGKG